MHDNINELRQLGAKTCRAVGTTIFNVFSYDAWFGPSIEPITFHKTLSGRGFDLIYKVHLLLEKEKQKILLLIKIF